MTNVPGSLEMDEGGIYLVNDFKSRRVQIGRQDELTGDERLRRVCEFSSRERQVFELLGEGLDMVDISKRMGLSVKTIETYRHRIKQKLNIKNRSVLLALAVRWRLMNQPMPMADDETATDSRR